MGRPDFHPSELSLLRKLSADGAQVVAWHHPPILQDRFPSPDVLGSLKDHGIPARTLTAVLGASVSSDVEEVVIHWTKSLGTRPLDAGRNFRETFRYRKLSLWWWAELYLYHETPLRLYVRDIETLKRLTEQERPARWVLVKPIRDLAHLAREMGLGAETHGQGERQPPSRPRTTKHSLAILLKMWGTGIKSMLRPKTDRPSSEKPRFLFLTHAPMWRERRRKDGSAELYEIYFDPILRALSEEGEKHKSIAVGPSIPYQRRSWRVALREFLEMGSKDLPYVSVRDTFTPSMIPVLSRVHWACWRDWRRFRGLPGVKKGFEHRGIRVDGPAMEAFRATFLLQLPSMIRSYHEVLNALKREQPSVLLLYAESSGLGRAAIAAACEKNVPTFAVQHGIMYPQYYSYEHRPDEVGARLDGIDACPLPTRTAVFGSLARNLLITRGNYPPERLVVTGSPKFDALLEAAATCDRDDIRRRYAVPASATLLVVASRFSAIGLVFRDIVKAVKDDPSVWVLVKPHQAERPDRYERVIEEEKAPRMSLVPIDENLLQLLAASDGLITVDSFASSEALVLDRPVFVVNLPNHLESLVECGAALGAGGGDEIAPQMKRFLHDPRVQADLERSRRQYRQEFASGADGKSTERILAALRETASSPEGRE